MSNEKFTPGPWHKRFQGNEIEIKSGIYTIAMAHDFSGDHEENLANAFLIQASPEMYQALKSILPYLKATGTNGNHWVPIIENVLAKANPETEKTSI